MQVAVERAVERAVEEKEIEIGPAVSVSDLEKYQVFDKYFHICRELPQHCVSCDREHILEELLMLPPTGRYSFQYYLASCDSKLSYDNPVVEITTFEVSDIKQLNKKFFEAGRLIGLDHGHHVGTVKDVPKTTCHVSNLVLFHYHNRGTHRLIQKCRNDIVNLGYVKDINNITELQKKAKMRIPGYHNIETYLKFVRNGADYLCQCNRTKKGVTVSQLSDKIKSLKINYHMK